MALTERPEAEQAEVLADRPSTGGPGAQPSAFSARRTALVVGLVGAALLLVPFVVPAYYVTKMLPFFAYGVTLLGLNLLFGYTGLLSFGHALFLGLGAYTVAVATTGLGIRSMEIILVLAAVVAALVAVPVGALCVRYVRIYFGMLTLAFGMLFYSFLIKFYAITGGDQGLRTLQPYLLGVFRARSGESVQFLSGPYYYYSALVLAILAFVMWRIVNSPFGLCLRSIRENPEKAEYLGVSVRRYRWYAFVISAVYAGVGGALLAPVTGQVDPTLAYWTHSGNLVFMTLLGGFTSFFGPLLGAFVFIFLQDWIMSVVPYWRLVFGAILALIVVFAPSGLMGLLERVPLPGAERGGTPSPRRGGG
jgi:branched-chain amino acid transport system permease protein